MATETIVTCDQCGERIDYDSANYELKGVGRGLDFCQWSCVVKYVQHVEENKPAPRCRARAWHATRGYLVCGLPPDHSGPGHVSTMGTEFETAPANA